MLNLICEKCGIDMTKKIIYKGKKRLNIGKAVNPKEGKPTLLCKECNEKRKEKTARYKFGVI